MDGTGKWSKMQRCFFANDEKKLVAGVIRSR